MEKIILVDGHAQIFRMFYAFMSHPLINSKGKNVSIMYGFTKMVLELLQKERPTHIVVAFDSHAPTFRHTAYKEYKANRPPAPEEVVESLEPIKDILKALNIKYVMQDGVEADDLIGSMATQWDDGRCTIYMVTPDKDYGQLISKNIFQYKLPKGGNGTTEILGEKEICALYGITNPHSVADILAIWGDSSDNVPGVKGIGEVGAKKLIGKYGTIENMLSHIEELPGKQQEKILQSKEWLPMSKFLVTIKTDVELPLAKEEIRVEQPNAGEIERVFSKYEFNSLKKIIEKGASEYPQTAEQELLSDYPEDNFDDLELAPPEHISDEEFVKIALEGKEVGLEIVGEKTIILAAKNCYITDTELLKAQATIPLPHAVRQIIEDEDIAKVGTNLKEYCKLLKSRSGITLGGELYDLSLVHYIINPELSHNTDFIFRETIGIGENELANRNTQQEKGENGANSANNGSLDLFSSLSDSQSDSLSAHEIESSAFKTSLYPIVKERLIARLDNKTCLYTDIEMPLIQVLADMELTGVKIDTEQLSAMSKELSAQMSQIEKEAREMAGDFALNLSSTKQIGVLLYEKLKVNPKVKKTAKGNYHTDEATLTSLQETHPIIGKILEYRNLKKLLSTYIDALPQLFNPLSGKVHTTYTQALTATGRLSSVNPNLQNIPVRTERGREIRKAFIPSTPDGVILSADYSQIELRLMAHFSEDKGLVEAFKSGEDIHAATAAKLFGVPVSEVSADQRRKAKTVNFGIIYGISPFGLSERMGIGVREARDFIEQYFRTYPGVKNYIDRIIEFARTNKYVETLYGRRRYLAEILSRNAQVRAFNERNAVNAPLQGSASDIIKIAMIRIAKRFAELRLKSKMILQVHDELIFDVIAEELDIVTQTVKNEMNNVVELRVPLETECGYGKNWLEAH